MRGLWMTAYAAEAEATGNKISLEVIVWGICIGLMIGVIVAFIQRRALGGAVKRIIRQQIFTPESAKTLDELGCRCNPLLRRALRPGKPMRKMVYCDNEAEVTDACKSTSFARVMRRIFSMEAKTGRFHAEKGRYYIPEDLRYTAEKRYETDGFTPAALILSLVLIAAAAYVLLYVAPDVISFLQAFFPA